MKEGLIVGRIDSAEYAGIFGGSVSNFFNSPKFALLNSHKTGKVDWLCFNDEKGEPRAGLICGTSDGVTESPFSAPYSFFTFKRKLSAARWRELAEAVSQAGVGHITLPPLCYGEEIQKAVAALMGKGWIIDYADTNYHIDITCDIDGMFTPKARGHLRRAIRSGVRTVKLDPGRLPDVERAYGIIRINRESRGYSLRMSCKEVFETLQLSGGAIYVASADGEDVASAIIYNVSPAEAQLIYWGDTRERPELCGMYALAAEVTRDLKCAGYKLLDLGPSSSHGKAASGQCDFKESVGGVMSIKFRISNPRRQLL